MARLFITPREIDYISDITKEVTKDIIGQVIYYYKTRVDLGNPHEVYDEMLERVFDPPIEVDARIDWGSLDVKQDRFGHEAIRTCTVYLHFRDLLDRNIIISEGDFFSYGDQFFEITSVKKDKMIFGQVEHITGYILSARQARKGLIDKILNGPTSEEYNDPDAVQTVFEQQRGSASKNDKRQLQSDEILDQPISSPKKVAPTSTGKSSFYGDE